jgi:uncharacterized protein (TIGR03000 family)
MLRKTITFAGPLLVAATLLLAPRPSQAAPHGGFHAGGFHAGGFHAGGFHAGGFGAGGLHYGGLHYGGLHYGGLNYGGLNYGGLNYGGLNYGALRYGGFRPYSYYRPYYAFPRYYANRLGYYPYFSRYNGYGLGYYPYGGAYYPYYGSYYPYAYGDYPYYDYSYPYISGYPTVSADLGSDLISDPGYASSYYQPAPSAVNASPAQADTVAHVTVSVPADAELWFNDTKMSATGGIREFHTPTLTLGKRYSYDVRARWNDNGHEVTQTERFEVTPGAHLTIAFPLPPKSK